MSIFAGFFLLYHLITLLTADVLVYFWHKYSTEKWIYLQKCKSVSVRAAAAEILLPKSGSAADFTIPL